MDELTNSLSDIFDCYIKFQIKECLKATLFVAKISKRYYETNNYDTGALIAETVNCNNSMVEISDNQSNEDDLILTHKLIEQHLSRLYLIISVGNLISNLSIELIRAITDVLAKEYYQKYNYLIVDTSKLLNYKINILIELHDITYNMNDTNSKQLVFSITKTKLYKAKSSFVAELSQKINYINSNLISIPQYNYLICNKNKNNREILSEATEKYSYMNFEIAINDNIQIENPIYIYCLSNYLNISLICFYIAFNSSTTQLTTIYPLDIDEIFFYCTKIKQPTINLSYLETTSTIRKLNILFLHLQGLTDKIL